MTEKRKTSNRRRLISLGLVLLVILVIRASTVQERIMQAKEEIFAILLGVIITGAAHWFFDWLIGFKAKKRGFLGLILAIMPGVVYFGVDQTSSMGWLWLVAAIIGAIMLFTAFRSRTQTSS
jgi:hypothetical protein